jgi:uncharacterized membrane protein
MNHTTRDGQILPQRRQLFIWQMAVMWLIFSAAIMVIGLLVLAWTAATSGGWWSGQASLATTFTVVTLLVLVVFGWEQWVLFSADAIEDKADNGDGSLRI